MQLWRESPSQQKKFKLRRKRLRKKKPNLALKAKNLNPHQKNKLQKIKKTKM
jgi:hypothetical protein